MRPLETIFEPPVLPWHRWRRRLAIATTAVVLGTGGAWAARTVIVSCGSPTSGIVEVDGECIGVSDGSFAFFPTSNVEAKIHDENERVVRESDRTGVPYVDVALLGPLTQSPGSPGGFSEEQVLHTLQGAHIAQLRANQPKPDPETLGFGDDGTPLIRLLLANEGSRQKQWEPVVERLKAMVTDAEHPLVAVTGLGVSIDETRLAAEALSQVSVAMVGAVTSADGLDHAMIPGLIRVSPSNADYVDALARFLEGRPDLRRGMVVYDANPSDSYVQNLKGDFERTLAPYIQFPSKSFSGHVAASGATPARFASIVSSICNVKPDMVLYAGREVDLDRGFIDTLKSRECHDTPLAILTGVTGFTTIAPKERELHDARITVIWAAPVDAESWSRRGPGTPRYYPDFERAYMKNFRKDELADSYAIMSHDALATAVKAIRDAVEGTDAVPTAADVASVLLNLNLGQEVKAASGTLSFSDLRHGNPEGKPIPILQVPAPATADDRPPYRTPSRGS